MIVSWIDIEGLSKAIDDLTDIRSFLDSAEFTTALHDIRTYSKILWKDEVYDFFNARLSLGKSVTGQLGESLVVNIGKKRITFNMGKMYHASRTDNYEYGHLLRDGFDGSLGAYNPKYDKRMDHGWHPGYDASTRWDPWIEYYRDEIREVSAVYTRRAFTEWQRNRGMI